MIGIVDALTLMSGANSLDEQTRLELAVAEASSLAGVASLWWDEAETNDLCAQSVDRLAKEVGGPTYEAAVNAWRTMPAAQNDVVCDILASDLPMAYYVGLARGWRAAQRIGGAQ